MWLRECRSTRCRESGSQPVAPVLDYEVNTSLLLMLTNAPSAPVTVRFGMLIK